MYFKQAACSTFQSCILNSHSGHTMCGSMVGNIQYATAVNRRGKTKDIKIEKIEEKTTGQKYNGLPYSIGRAAITRKWTKKNNRP